MRAECTISRTENHGPNAPFSPLQTAPSKNFGSARPVPSGRARAPDAPHALHSRRAPRQHFAKIQKKTVKTVRKKQPGARRSGGAPLLYVYRHKHAHKWGAPLLYVGISTPRPEAGRVGGGAADPSR